jgi:DegV family protein with EDD domain
MSVRIVTDSTSDLPSEAAERLGVTVVAQNVHFGEQTFKDNVTLTPEEFYPMLAASAELPKTSQASPGDFKEVYDRLGEDADGIISIHVSAKLSGTYNSAVQAASLTSASCPVKVIDTAQASMGLGLAVVAAAEAAGGGADHDEVSTVANDAVTRVQCMCLFETLEYLEKGGRIGRASALIGSVLSIKPMIIIRGGQVQQLGKARKFSRGLAKLRQTVQEFEPLEALAVMHSTTPQAAEQLAGDLGDLLPEGTDPYVARFGPALGVYTGPGAIGIALLQARG